MGGAVSCVQGLLLENAIGHPFAYTSYTYELTDAHNVQQVLAWADANARGRTYQVFLAFDDPARGVGLFSLCGSTPTRPSDPRAVPPPELQAETEGAGAEYLAKEREQAEARVRRWLELDPP
jgi:hypothetical protein